MLVAMRVFKVVRTIVSCSLVISICFIGLLALSSPTHAFFFNRSYSTLEETLPLKGDFDSILQSGKLRILLPQDFTSVTYLPRRKSPLAEQQRMAEEFALSHGLTPELIFVKNFAELIPALEAGKGDVIINNLTINDQRRKKISFSVPVTHVREQIIVRRDDDRITRVRDLVGKTIMVNRDSTFWHALQWLKDNKYPEIDLKPAPDHVKREQIIDLLANGAIDATILDSNLVEILLGYRDDIKVAANFSGQRNIGWGIRKGAPRLVSEINRFLQLEHMASESESVYTDDFDQIKKRKVIRVILRNSAASYFLYRGELMGFEYELAKEFARYHSLRLEVVVPSSRAEMASWLLEGKADMAMGFFEVDPELGALGVGYSRPYHFARQHVVVQKNNPARQLSELKKTNISVPRDSRDWHRLARLQRQGFEFNLLASDKKLDVEQLVQQVSSGALEATLVDEHVLDIELAESKKIRSAVVLEDEVPHVIAVRAKNEDLKAVLDGFIKRIYRKEFYNVLYQKYFKSRKSVARLAQGRIANTQSGKISPFDNLVQKYSDKYGFDWRLIAAQMYQESGFDPNARSHTGARGLMQLMPRTARSLGVSKLDEPAGSIKGGVKYMDWLRDRFDNDLPISERLWFSLAAYNAGVGHVHDARRLAKHLGKDPDRWFENTESAMLLLSKGKYAKKARYGFVNGKEPVNYVRQIKQRFEAYVALSGHLLSWTPVLPEAISVLVAGLPRSQTDQFVNVIRRTSTRKVIRGLFQTL